MTHIERLLLEHDCVIIPDVGGFVLQYRPASFVRETGMFLPGGKDVVFNPTLQHDDGLLAESYMKSYGTDYRKACAMRQEDTQELKSALKTQRRVSLGSMGVFRTEGESVLFEPSGSALFSVDSYGLEEFMLPPLSVLREHAEKRPVQKAVSKDIVYIPVNRRLLRAMVSSAAAIALFFLLSTPVKQTDTSVYTASFVPAQVTEMRTVQPAEAATVAEPEAIPEAVEAEAVETEAVSPVPAEVKTEAVPVVRNEKYYHIIIASFPGTAQAEKYLQTVDRSVYTGAGIVERSGKFRVYAGKFTDRQLADEYLNTLRAGSKHTDAWMFISR